MSTGHSTIVQTDRGIGIDELSRICHVAEDFRKPDDLEQQASACCAGLPCRQGWRHE